MQSFEKRSFEKGFKSLKSGDRSKNIFLTEQQRVN